MKKKIISRPYEGDLQDLVAFALTKIDEMYVVKFQGKVYSFGNDLRHAFHTSEGYAKKALRDHIFGNYCQGHYWHKGKKNTFAFEKGWSRNNGYVDQSRKEFKKMSEEMTEWLLENKIFTIEKISL